MPASNKSPSPIDQHIGARVRMRRVMCGISQERLGDALKLTFQQVQKYERGTNRIGGSRLHQIAQALGVPAAFFFEGLPGGAAAPFSAKPDLVAAFFTLSGATELAGHFTAIESTADRHIVVDVARAIARNARRAAVKAAA
jgi:transcriptional regulator with XRE-family HTH domain